MSSFEERFYLHNPGLWQLAKRNTSLLYDSAVFLIIWMTKGRKIRKALRQAEQENTRVVLEDYLGE
ncbi:MAG: hypothetical protein ACI9SC_001664 [Gammaproteobacteria bacterium]|jgi:hypothetical protein